jgi:CHAD domain-containing protein
LTEIELELIEGEPGPLYALALSLASDLPVTVSQTSKSERGYALASHAPRKPLRAGKITLAPDISVGAALARVGSDCLTQIGANAQSVGASDGEFVHQARVGTRRLRSLLNIVADLKGPDTVLPLLQELRWLSASLGAARDWDVLASETLASVTQALRHAQARRDVGTLRGRVTRQRNIHFAEAAAAAVSPRAQRLLLAFGALFAELESSAAEPALRAPARTLAKDILERRARRLGKRAAHLRRVSPDERHQARIAAKKLRYVAEMFAPLFAGNRTREYLSALGKLQSELGRLNDLATGERLLDEVEKLTHAQRLVHGAGIARGWLAGAEASAVTDAARAWRKLAKQKPFWR